MCGAAEPKEADRVEDVCGSLEDVERNVEMYMRTLKEVDERALDAHTELFGTILTYCHCGRPFAARGIRCVLMAVLVMVC